MTKLTARNREVEQGIVFKLLMDGLILQKEAAASLQMTPRGVRKKFKRYCQEGEAGLAHKNRGKPSKRRLSEEDWTKHRNYSKVQHGVVLDLPLPLKN